MRVNAIIVKPPATPGNTALPALEDTDLPARIRAGDRSAIQTVVETYLGQILRAARSAGLDASRAEDVTQATFTTFIEAAPRFEGRSSVRTWLFGILYNKIAEARRARDRDAMANARKCNYCETAGHPSTALPALEDTDLPARTGRAIAAPSRRSSRPTSARFSGRLGVRASMRPGRKTSPRPPSPPLSRRPRASRGGPASGRGSSVSSTTRSPRRGVRAIETDSWTTLTKSSSAASTPQASGARRPCRWTPTCRIRRSAARSSPASTRRLPGRA